MRKFSSVLLIMLFSFVLLQRAKCQTVSPQINVKSLGAVGDGNHDDGPVIQKVLNSATPDKVITVWLPPGKYHIVNPGNGRGANGYYGLKIHSNTILKMAKGAVLIKAGNGALLSNFTTEAVRNISITGGEMMSSSGIEGRWVQGKDGIFLTDATKVLIKGVRFHHMGDRGVILNGNSIDVQIIDNEFYDIFNTAVSLNMQAVSRILIEGNSIYNIGGDGIIINGNNSMIRNNKLTNVGYMAGKPYGSGIALGTDKRSCSYDTLSGNIITGVGAFGIISNNCLGSVILHNQITRCRMSGIKVGAGSKKSIIESNRIIGAGSADWDNGMYGKSGIVLQGAGSVVQGNDLDSITGTGIYVDKYGSGSKINANTVNTLLQRKALLNSAIVNDADNISISHNVLNNRNGFGIILGNKYLPKGTVLSNNKNPSGKLINRAKKGLGYKNADKSLQFELIK